MDKEFRLRRFAAKIKTTNMKKLYLSALLVIFSFGGTMAQSDKTFSVSVGPELAFATGSFSQSHSIGSGGTVQVEYLVKERLKATATVGVLAFIGKSRPNFTTNYPSQRVIPFRIGAKYYLTGNLYGGAQLGVAFRNNYAPYSGTAFAYSPLMLGYEFTIKDNKAIDATLKYDASSGSGGTISAMGFRLAYIF